MKSIITSLLLIVLSINFATAQSDWRGGFSMTHQKNDMSLGFGFNFVDDSGTQFKDIFDINSNWNFGGFPLAVNFEYYLNSKFSIASQFSLNKYSEGKKINGGIVLKDNEANYLAVDIAGKFSFLELLNAKRFEPYITLGVGYNNIGTFKTNQSLEEIPENDSFTFNTGIGLNYWMSNNWAMNLNTVGKFDFSEGAGNHIQYSFGVMYILPKQ